MASSAMVRSSGVLALALSASSLMRTSSAFNRSILRRASSRASHNCASSRNHNGNGNMIIRHNTVSADDPSLTSGDNDFEWLRQSRPMRIKARLITPNGEDSKASSSSPAETIKIVHFQRHGQGLHNEIYKQWTERTGEPLDLAETDPEKNPLLLDHVIDAPLTQKGRDQCAEQRSAASKLQGVELVIVSPLVRALQTAHITFEDHLPHNSPENAKWIAHDGIREELGTLLCNKRRPLSETELEFPQVDYSHLPFGNGEEDVVWNNHVQVTSDDNGIPKRETTEDMSHRAYDFLVNFLHQRQEKEIAVVGHSAWLLAMTGAVLDVKKDENGLVNTMFGQAEMRSFELIFSEQ